MLFRFPTMLYFVTFWPRISWSQVFWAALAAAATWLLKKLWDAWSEQSWTVFKTSYTAGLKKTPEGQRLIEEFHKAKAEKCMKIVKEHPELEKMLQCKACGGKGCDDCGGTGWG